MCATTDCLWCQRRIWKGEDPICLAFCRIGFEEGRFATTDSTWTRTPLKCPGKPPLIRQGVPRYNFETASILYLLWCTLKCRRILKRKRIHAACAVIHRRTERHIALKGTMEGNKAKWHVSNIHGIITQIIMRNILWTMECAAAGRMEAFTPIAQGNRAVNEKKERKHVKQEEIIRERSHSNAAFRFVYYAVTDQLFHYAQQLRRRPRDSGQSEVCCCQIHSGEIWGPDALLSSAYYSYFHAVQHGWLCSALRSRIVHTRAVESVVKRISISFATRTPVRVFKLELALAFVVPVTCSGSIIE